MQNREDEAFLFNATPARASDSDVHLAHPSKHYATIGLEMDLRNNLWANKDQKATEKS